MLFTKWSKILKSVGWIRTTSASSQPSIYWSGSAKVLHDGRYKTWTCIDNMSVCANQVLANNFNTTCANYRIKYDTNMIHRYIIETLKMEYLLVSILWIPAYHVIYTIQCWAMQTRTWGLLECCCYASTSAKTSSNSKNSLWRLMMTVICIKGTVTLPYM